MNSSLRSRLTAIVIAMATTCILASCSSDDNPFIPQSYLDGKWLDTTADDIQRTITFDGASGNATYSASYFSPDYLKEEVCVPYTFDGRKGEVVMDFSGTDNKTGISLIQLQASSETEHMIGAIRYSDESQEPDSLCLYHLDGPFEEGRIGESFEHPFGQEMGPQSRLDELPRLEWENPFTESTVKGSEDNIAGITILSYLGKTIGNAAVSALAKKLFGELWTEILPEDPMSSNIKKIVQDVESIKKQLQAIEQKLDELIREQRLEKACRSMSARNKSFINLNASVSNALLFIESEMKGRTDPTELSQAIQSAVLEWGSGISDGNQLYNAVEIYVGMASSSESLQTYPDIYDAFAYETNPWESDGYEWREMLRTTDQAIVGVASALTVMYWTARHNAQPDKVSKATLEAQIDKQVSLLKTMDDLYRSKAVERHPDRMICQIYGFHKVFSKDVEWRDLENPTWYPNDHHMNLSAEWLVFGKERYGIYRERFMTRNEFSTLSKYYSGHTGSILSLFKEIGFNVRTDNTEDPRAKMVLPEGAVYTTKISMDQNNDIRINHAINNVSKDVDWFTVGEVYAPGHYEGFLKWIKIFDHYVSYNDYTWFNLEVLQR